MFEKMYLVLLISLFFYAQGTDLSTTRTVEPIYGALEDCLQESGADLSLVKLLRTGNYSISNPALKKWALCYLVKTGVMSSSGVLRQHVVLQDISDKDKNLIEKTINECLYKDLHEPAETAWHYLTCFQYKQPQHAKNANRI